MTERVEGTYGEPEPPGQDLRDPERLLGELPVESPPPEIVLAAIRVFRYRALLALVLVTALSVIGVFVAQRYFGPVSTDDVIAAARHSGGAYPLALERDVGGIHVLLWEVVAADVRGGRRTTAYLHLQAWDDFGASIELRVTRLAIQGLAVPTTELGSAGSCCPSNEESWVQFVAPRGVAPPITADVRVISQPPAGGASSVLGTLHFETGAELP
jgi:hypothetical protein